MNPTISTFQGLFFCADQDHKDSNKETAKKELVSAVNQLDWSVHPIVSSKNWTVAFVGLSTLPCHGLVDTGAQEGAVGLRHWQRWVVCHGQCFKLRPAFLPIPDQATAGGIGGSAKISAMCDMPAGLAGANGLTRWVVLDDSVA